MIFKKKRKKKKKIFEFKKDSILQNLKKKFPKI